MITAFVPTQLYSSSAYLPVTAEARAGATTDRQGRPVPPTVSNTPSIDLDVSDDRSASGLVSTQRVSATAAGEQSAATAGATDQATAEEQTASTPSVQSELSELSEEELQLVDELQARDREVRNHERAHQTAGGGLTGAVSYQYEDGPDGQRYAVGGEVSIDTSMPEEPRAAIQRAQTIIGAALAPVQPSAQDYRVAAQARAALTVAQAELVAVQRAQQTEGESQVSNTAGDGGNATSIPVDSLASEKSAPATEQSPVTRQLQRIGVFAGPVPGSVIDATA